MTEKFKYGPLVWNHMGDEDDSGNYWWPGLAPVAYDNTGIPIDAKGLQTLPLTCPLHPGYAIKDSVFSANINEHLPSIDEWQEWFDEHFIKIDEAWIKREILRWYAKDSKRVTSNFASLYSKCKNLQEMVEAVWPQDENK